MVFYAGIAHLHEGVNPSIIHRDIKPSNILVGEGFEAKVSDFGLVKSGPVGDESHVSSQIKGTPGYLDPAYCSSFHLSPFSDVYSFGVILLQLISARRAVDTSRPQAQFHIIDWVCIEMLTIALFQLRAKVSLNLLNFQARPSLERGIVEDIIDANLLLEACNMEMMLRMGQLALRCVVKKPKNRPTMSQVAQELEEALKSCIVPVHRKSNDQEESVSFSINGVGLEGFHMEEDDFSIQSVAMRCLDVSGIDVNHSVDVGNVGQLVGITEIDESESPSVPLSKFQKIIKLEL